MVNPKFLQIVGGNSFNAQVKKGRKSSTADSQGKMLTLSGIGNVTVKEASSNNNLKLKNVLNIPELNSKLFSLARIADHGYDVSFNKYGEIRTAAVPPVSEVRRKQLQHAHKGIVEGMKRGNQDFGTDSSWKRVCEPCAQGKACKKPHPGYNATWTNRTLELWRTDLVGPIKPSGYGKKNSLLAVVGDYSRVMFMQLLWDKGEAAEELKDIMELKEDQTELRLKGIMSDKFREYLGKEL
ncbi:PREDICTED: uncharacterized protein LOC108553994 [Eufriesea mexicana]|uniref:uncharacterized protein LOC108553994 n=1 Tax=Eufriesea mexicana TaxID=516756 RepID=UPI00083C3706|nr:PREDICTED: uncharacterized protein LOC108553994 [Eufriesea mexicana]